MSPNLTQSTVTSDLSVTSNLPVTSNLSVASSTSVIPLTLTSSMTLRQHQRNQSQSVLVSQLLKPGGTTTKGQMEVQSEGQGQSNVEGQGHQESNIVEQHALLQRALQTGVPLLPQISSSLPSRNTMPRKRPTVQQHSRDILAQALLASHSDIETSEPAVSEAPGTISMTSNVVSSSAAGNAGIDLSVNQQNPGVSQQQVQEELTSKLQVESQGPTLGLDSSMHPFTLLYNAAHPQGELDRTAENHTLSVEGVDRTPITGNRFDGNQPITSKIPKEIECNLISQIMQDSGKIMVTQGAAVQGQPQNQGRYSMPPDAYEIHRAITEHRQRRQSHSSVEGHHSNPGHQDNPSLPDNPIHTSFHGNSAGHDTKPGSHDNQNNDSHYGNSRSPGHVIGGEDHSISTTESNTEPTSDQTPQPEYKEPNYKKPNYKQPNYTTTTEQVESPPAKERPSILPHSILRLIQQHHEQSSKQQTSPGKNISFGKVISLGNGQSQTSIHGATIQDGTGLLGSQRLLVSQSEQPLATPTNSQIERPRIVPPSTQSETVQDRTRIIHQSSSDEGQGPQGREERIDIRRMSWGLSDNERVQGNIIQDRVNFQLESGHKWLESGHRLVPNSQLISILTQTNVSNSNTQSVGQESNLVKERGDAGRLMQSEGSQLSSRKFNQNTRNEIAQDTSITEEQSGRSSGINLSIQEQQVGVAVSEQQDSSVGNGDVSVEEQNEEKVEILIIKEDDQSASEPQHSMQMIPTSQGGIKQHILKVESHIQEAPVSQPNKSYPIDKGSMGNVQLSKAQQNQGAIHVPQAQNNQAHKAALHAAAVMPGPPQVFHINQVLPAPLAPHPVQASPPQAPLVHQAGQNDQVPIAQPAAAHVPAQQPAPQPVLDHQQPPNQVSSQ